jgi:hypothetical protein
MFQNGTVTDELSIKALDLARLELELTRDRLQQLINRSTDYDLCIRLSAVINTIDAAAAKLLALQQRKGGDVTQQTTGGGVPSVLFLIG